MEPYLSPWKQGEAEGGGGGGREVSFGIMGLTSKRVSKIVACAHRVFLYMTLNSCSIFAYSIVERLNLERGQNKLLPAQRAESVLSQRSSPHIMTGIVSLRRRLLVLILRWRQQCSFVFSDRKGKEGLQILVLFLWKTPQVGSVVVSSSGCY